MKKLLLSVIAAISALVIPTQADEYKLIGTLWNSTGTNIPAAVTNIAGVLNVQRYSSFALEVRGGYTNAQIGTLDLHWCVSQDGITYCNSAGQSGASGTIVVPLTNTTTFYWTTNITVGAYGWWQIDAGTNNGSHLTNCVIKAYAKPEQTF